MRKKKYILLAILLMAIGFAAVTTTLFINGTTVISENQSDFKVLYTNAILDNVQDNSIITDDTHIVFTTKELKNVGDKSILVYTIKNNSKNYDADITMSFSPESTEYIRVTNTLEDNELASNETTNGTLTIELIKGYVGETALEESVSVEIVASAKERNVIGDVSPVVRVVAKDINGNNLQASSRSVIGEDKTIFLNKLTEFNLINNKDEVAALIGVTTSDFDDLALTEFNVSSVANEGDIVVLLEYDESTGYWKFVTESIVTNGKVGGNFQEFTPIAFIVQNINGTYSDLDPVCEVSSGECDLDTIGSEVRIGTEHFYVMGTDDSNNVKLMGKYNLNVGNNLQPVEYGALGMQNSHSIGDNGDKNTKVNGSYPSTVTLSNYAYFYYDDTIEYPFYYVDDDRFQYKDVIDTYLLNLQQINNKVVSCGMVKYEDLIALGCANNSCSNAPEWVYSVSYWTGTARSKSNYYFVKYTKSFISGGGNVSGQGIRPVIILQK